MEKIILSILLLLPINLLAQGGMMPSPGTAHISSTGAAFVQQASGTDGGGIVNPNFPSNVTAGNSLICVVSYLSTDSLSGVAQGVNFLTLAQHSTVSGVSVDIYYKHSVTGGTLSTDVETNSGTRVSVNWSEWSGLKNAVPESLNTNSALAGTTVTTNTATPSSTNNLIIAGGAWTANNYSSGPINSFTRMTQTGGGAAWQESAYKIQSAATANSTGWSLTVGINWAAAIAAFGAN